MAYSVSHVIGADLNNPVPVSFSYTTGSTAITIPAIGPLGMQVWGSDGKRYVLAKAGNTFTSGAAAQISASTFIATTYASGTSYTSPTVTGGLATNDVAWFSATSV